MTHEADNPKGDDLSRIRRNAKRLLRDAKLLSDNSQTSKSAWRNARKNISSGDSSRNLGFTPSITTLPSARGRVRS